MSGHRGRIAAAAVLMAVSASGGADERRADLGALAAGAVDATHQLHYSAEEPLAKRITVTVDGAGNVRAAVATPVPFCSEPWNADCWNTAVAEGQLDVDRSRRLIAAAAAIVGRQLGSSTPPPPGAGHAVVTVSGPQLDAVAASLGRGADASADQLAATLNALAESVVEGSSLDI